MARGPIRRLRNPWARGGGSGGGRVMMALRRCDLHRHGDAWCTIGTRNEPSTGVCSKEGVVEAREGVSWRWRCTEQDGAPPLALAFIREAGSVDMGERILVLNGEGGRVRQIYFGCHIWGEGVVVTAVIYRNGSKTLHSRLGQGRVWW
jgi:hypothetical protein